MVTLFDLLPIYECNVLVVGLIQHYSTIACQGGLVQQPMFSTIAFVKLHWERTEQQQTAMAMKYNVTISPEHD